MRVRKEKKKEKVWMKVREDKWKEGNGEEERARGREGRREGGRERERERERERMK